MVLEHVGRWVYRRRAAVLCAWLVLVLLGGVLGGAAFDRAKAPGDRAGVESTVVAQRIDAAVPEGKQITVLLSGAEPRSNDMINRASQVVYELRALPGVKIVTDPYTAGATDMFGDQGFAVQIEFDPTLSDEAALEVAAQAEELLRTIGFPEVRMGGELLAEQLFIDQAVQDAAIGEGVALVLLFGLLVLVLGGWLLGAIPVVTALAGLAVSLLALTGLSFVGPLSEYAVNVVTLLGLGLAIDYSLLVLARFREERAAVRALRSTGRGRRGAGSKPAAARSPGRAESDAQDDVASLLAVTLGRAGHTVLISGVTVGCALAALLLLGDPMLTGMAVGGLIAVTVATAAGLTLAPALIAVTHHRISDPGQGWFAARRARRRVALLPRLAEFAQARPWPTLLGGVLLLLVLASPLLALQVGNSDARSLPDGSEPRVVHEMVEQEYPDLAVAPITVLAEIGAGDELVGDLMQQLDDLPGADEVLMGDALPDGTTRLVVIPDGPTTGEVALGLVTRIREMDTVAPVTVGGPAAELLDAKDQLGARVPAAVLAVVLATGLLLLWLTRAPVVALKTVLLNLLSLAATLGVVVAIFQWGWGSSLLGFTSWGAVDITTPLLLFMFCFGLSMDYHMFLVARIKESWDAEPGDRAANDRAVRTGIIASGPVVTLAALAISFVFLGFAAGQLTAVKEIGVGMTVAIVLDVTVVRGLLLPASMTLLGRLNWWWPGTRLRVPASSVETG